MGEACFEETFMFQKIAHASATAQDQLGDVLYNLALRFWRDGGKPLGETDFACDITGYRCNGYASDIRIPWRETRRI
jgi:hypothetical protein